MHPLFFLCLGGVSIRKDTDEPRVNHRIRASEIRVIGSDGEQLGVMTPQDAIERAEELGFDLVEVAPAYDTSGNTSLVAANLLFEMLCVLPGVEYR